MTNELTQDAEGSETIEKTASEQPETTTTETEAVSTEPTAEAAPAESEPVAEIVEAPVAEALAEPVAATESTPEPVAEVAPTPVAAAPAEPVGEESQAPNDIDFGAILEQFEQEQTVYHNGELVEGKVVGITDRGVLVDFGYKSEGFVPLEEFTDMSGEMTAKVGDAVEVVIRSINSGDSAPQLSRFDAVGRKVWDEIEAAFNSETPVTGKVVDKTKGGLRIDLNGIEAFLPGSQIDSRPIRGLDSYLSLIHI